MRILLLASALLACAGGDNCLPAQPPLPAGQLVRQVVYNEQNDHQRHGFWRYWVARRSESGITVTEQVETAQGPVARLALNDGHALGPEAQQHEQDRLQQLLASPGEQARRQRQYDEDEERIGRILALLPDAFVFDYDGEENGCFRLRFRPNPGYGANHAEQRIFHAMSGALWIDARAKRLTRLDGRIDRNVDFGLGIIGRLYQGGWFRLVRQQVSPTDWKTSSLDVHLNLRALLVKTFARDISETRGGFTPVPPGLSLAQGLALLDKQQAELQPLSVRH